MTEVRSSHLDLAAAPFPGAGTAELLDAASIHHVVAARVAQRLAERSHPAAPVRRLVGPDGADAAAVWLRARELAEGQPPLVVTSNASVPLSGEVLRTARLTRRTTPRSPQRFHRGPVLAVAPDEVTLPFAVDLAGNFSLVIVGSHLTSWRVWAARCKAHTAVPALSVGAAQALDHWVSTAESVGWSSRRVEASAAALLDVHATGGMRADDVSAAALLAGCPPLRSRALRLRLSHMGRAQR